ncbi:MAG TPA: hypothetical protein VMQ73_07810 [Methylomirabilota bacterium]|nr:hypothetical protein [Methylomirabilota bacterium]
MGPGSGQGAQLTAGVSFTPPMSGDEFVDRALRLAGAKTSDLICVAGPGALPAMLRLCRYGFENAECAWRATCAVADRPRDLLLLAGESNAQALARTVRLVSRVLRDGGLLVAQLTAADHAAVIAPALASVGRCSIAIGELRDLVAVRVLRWEPMTLAASGRNPCC